MLAIGVIDYQNDFVKEDGALSVKGAEAFYDSGVIEKIVEFGKLIDAKVFYTADAHNGTEPEMIANGGPFPPHCMIGTKGMEFVNWRFGDIFYKKCYNVFDPELGSKYINNFLDYFKIDQVLLCGLVGNICVEATANGLRKLGIGVTIIENGVVWMDMEKGIFTPEVDNEEKSIARMKENGIKFINY